MRKIYNWLRKENRIFSFLLGCKTSNFSVVCEFAAILLFTLAFALANSSVGEESAIAQGLLATLATMATVPIIADIKLDKK